MNIIKIKTSYNKKYLTEFCRENKITLIGDYENIRINRRVHINAECVEKCGNIASCDFRQFVRNTGRCNPCLYKIKNKIRYDKKYLQEYCKLNKIELRQDYTSIKVSRETIIVAKCLTDNCQHNVEKTLRMIVDGGGCYCEGCTEKTRITKMQIADWGSDKTRFNNNYLKQFCEENNIHLVNDYTDIQVERDTIIVAKCLTENCTHNVEKTLRMIVQSSGCYCDECTEKRGITKMQIVDWESDKTRFNNNYLKQFCEENNIHLVNNYTDIEVNRETIVVAKCLTDNCENAVEKTLRRIIECGCYCQECTISNKCTKFKNTCLDRYGVENVSHDPEISERASKNAYKAYDYTFPSGRVDKIQGYEHFMLNDLLQKENVPEDDIVLGRNKVPVVNWYDEEDNVHTYFVDCFIKSQNRCIEAKSTWTAEKKKDCIFLKQQALKDAGYLCEIWIYDHNGARVECHL